MNSGLTAALWVPVAVVLAFALFRWLLPAKVAPSATTVPLDELARRYRKWEMAGIVPLFFFAAVLGYGWFLFLRAGASLLFPGPLQAVYVLAPEDAFWGVPAIFLGILSSAYPTVLLYKRLLRDRYAEYDAYTQLRAGFNTWAVFRILAIILPLAAAGFVLAAVNYATVFDERGITTKRLWGSGGGFHAYSTVSRIHTQDYFTAPNGNRVFRPHYVIEFSDGARWTTRDGLRTPDPALDATIMRFVAEKSARQVDAGGKDSRAR